MASVQELAWLTFLTVSSLIATQVNTETWLTIDALLTVFCAIVLIPFAEKLQQMETVGLKIDTIHVYLSNEYLCIILMPALAWFLMNRSKDKSHLISAVLLCRTGAGFLVTVLATLAHLQYGFFNSAHLYFGILSSAAWAVVNGYHLFNHGVIYGSGKESKLNLFLKLDIYLCLFYGLPDVFTPRLICYFQTLPADEHHFHLLQIIGGAFLGSAILSYMALSFSSESNKRTLLLSKIISTGLMWAIRTYLWMFVDTDTSFYNYFYACLGYGPLFTALAGLCQAM